MLRSSAALVRHKWRLAENAAAPEHYNDDFSSDKGFFTSDLGRGCTLISGGIMKITPPEKDIALTYLHIYEQNVTVKARMRYSDTPPMDSFFGFILRYSAEEAYVKLIYRAYSGFWCVDCREGADFPPIRLSQAKCPLEKGCWYDIEATVDGDTATVKVGGETVLTVSGIPHLTPGRPAFMAERLAVEIDSCDFAFLSDQGVLWRDAHHLILPDNKYREGGSCWELTDGSIRYQYHKGDTFRSNDKALTFEREDTWIKDPGGYMNVLSLGGGRFIRTARRIFDGVPYVVSLFSDDDGTTWREGGRICMAERDGNPNAHAGNMNDKLSVGASGRIYFGQNYAMKNGDTFGGRVVFCELFYTDDNGETWQKSETGSWEISGNETEKWFGECKLLECSDGTVRMYNSWNAYGCIVYSDSFDGGKTFGPLCKLPEFICARSSMQFTRDSYTGTHYMVWVYSEPQFSFDNPMGRSRLSLAKSEDGKNWQYLGDVWRWEHPYQNGAFIAHIVDPFIIATADRLIIGSGISERLAIPEAGDFPYHCAQRQHIWSVDKATLIPTELKPV